MIGLQEHWYQDEADGLFVVYPGSEGRVFVIGPTTETRDRLNRVYERCEQMGTAFARVHTDGVARALELQFIAAERRIEIKRGATSTLSVRPL